MRVGKSYMTLNYDWDDMEKY